MRLLAPSASILVLASSVLASPIDVSPVDVSPVDASPLNASSIDVSSIDVRSIDVATAGPTCTRDRTDLRYFYKIGIPNLPDRGTISHICANLWLELDMWALCVVTTPHGCEAASGSNSSLEWWFHTSKLCDTGRVEAAFFHATLENRWGGVKCKKN